MQAERIRADALRSLKPTNAKCDKCGQGFRRRKKDTKRTVCLISAGRGRQRSQSAPSAEVCQRSGRATSSSPPCLTRGGRMDGWTSGLLAGFRHDIPNCCRRGVAKCVVRPDQSLRPAAPAPPQALAGLRLSHGTANGSVDCVAPRVDGGTWPM